MRAADDRARDLGPAAESLDAVHEAAEPGARGRVGPADTVIDAQDEQPRAVPSDADVGDRGVLVLRDVREHLRDHVVGRHLDGRRQAILELDVELDGSAARSVSDSSARRSP
jgi:hypothetical protein